MKSSANYFIQSFFSELYLLLVKAAIAQRTIDMEAVVKSGIFNGFFMKPTAADSQALNDVLELLFDMDTKNNRLPLVALFVRHKDKHPGPSFFRMCVKHKLIPSKASEEDKHRYWEEMRNKIWDQYRMEVTL